MIVHTTANYEINSVTMIFGRVYPSSYVYNSVYTAGPNRTITKQNYVNAMMPNQQSG